MTLCSCWSYFTSIWMYGWSLGKWKWDLIIVLEFQVWLFCLRFSQLRRSIDSYRNFYSFILIWLFFFFYRKIQIQNIRLHQICRNFLFICHIFFIWNFRYWPFNSLPLLRMTYSVFFIFIRFVWISLKALFWLISKINAWCRSFYISLFYFLWLLFDIFLWLFSSFQWRFNSISLITWNFCIFLWWCFYSSF